MFRVLGVWSANRKLGTPIGSAARCPTNGDSVALSVRSSSSLLLRRHRFSVRLSMSEYNRFSSFRALDLLLQVIFSGLFGER
jgi:hypothetical protein